MCNRLTSLRARIYAGLGCLAFAFFELYAYWCTGNMILLPFALLMVSLAVNEFFQIYCHRHDPSRLPMQKQIPTDDGGKRYGAKK